MIWEKIKAAGKWIAGGIVAVLFVAVSVLTKILKRKNNEIENLKEENETKDIEAERNKNAKEKESKQAHELIDIKKKENENISNVENGKQSYNDLIGRWKNKILILIFSVFLTGCQTVKYIDADLPEINFIRPERPELEEVQGEVPTAATVNMVRLMSYAEQLENYADNWEQFYEGLKNGNRVH